MISIVYTGIVISLQTGSITLNLNKLVKPAKDVKKCSLKMIEKAGKVPTLNLFKNKRCKGWWPMHAREKEEGEDDKTEKLILKVTHASGNVCIRRLMVEVTHVQVHL